MARRRSNRRTKSTRNTDRRTARRSAGRTARRAARRTARRATGRTARRSAGRTARRTARRAVRENKVDAVSDILSAAYGIRRNVRKPKKSKKENSVDSFLGGIETTGPLDPAAIKVKGKAPKKKVVKEDSTGPLDPAAIKGNKVVVPKVKKAKRSGKKKSEWIDHVKAFYAEKKKSNPDYKYSQALKDAAASYKK
jgi:hypothetical protein